MILTVVVCCCRRKQRRDARSKRWLNESFNKSIPKAQRRALRQDPQVLGWLEQFWHVYRKDEDGCIERDEYLQAHGKIAKVLIPDLTPAERAAAGEEDWAVDAHGEGRMTRQQLHECLFELADMWVPVIDGEEYAAFLLALLDHVAPSKLGANGERVREFLTRVRARVRFLTRAKFRALDEWAASARGRRAAVRQSKDSTNCLAAFWDIFTEKNTGKGYGKC